MNLRKRLHDETGATLIAAVLIVIAMMALGLAMLAATDGQSKATARERTREASFNLAEAAMQAQALQLTRTWPANMGTPELSQTPACTPSTADARCPIPAAISNGYTSNDYGIACASNPSLPSWQVTVRDNNPTGQYWTQAHASAARYDANGDGVIWLHSQATTRCHTLAMVTLVSQQQIPITFPSNIVTANWFETTNNGKKVIVDTRGSAAQPSPIVVRCAGKTTAECLKYPADKGQVQPPAVRMDSSAPTRTLTDAQLTSLAAQAQAAGRYYSTCPPNTAAALTSVNGAPVYVKGPCDIRVTGNAPINTAAAPGALIIENGSLELGGNTTFYGLVYLVNKQNSNNALLKLGGTAAVVGSVAVDGAGGISAGASKMNLVFDPRAASLLKGSAGATLNKNTFRVVPTS